MLKMLFFKGKKKRQIIITSISAVVMLILTFLGDCKWEIFCTIIALLVMVIIIILSKEGQEDRIAIKSKKL